MNGAVITLTFDDGLLCQFDHGYPLLREAGANAVAFVPTGLLGAFYEGERTMTLAHLRELAAAGWEIGSHTVSHARLAGKDGRTRLPLGAVEAELRASKEWLEANGFRVSSLAYPNGRCNPEIERCARRYYRYMRTSEEGLNELCTANSRLRAFDLCHKKIHRWKRAVDAAVSQGGWLIAVVHGIAGSVATVPSGHESFWITKQGLAECIRYALSSGCRFRTFQETAAEYADA